MASALRHSISMERNPRAPACALAQSLSAVANGNLHRGQDAADSFHRILGVHLAGKSASVAFSEVDWGNGEVRTA
jgi:hypothetical protein